MTMLGRLAERRRMKREWRRFYRQLRADTASGRLHRRGDDDGAPLVTVAFDEHGRQVTVLGEEPVQGGQVVSVAARSLAARAGEGR